MNLNPLSWLRAGRSAKEFLRADNPRAAAPQGPWTVWFSDWVPRNIAPRFYEALRESISTIDGGIDRLLMMDGILRVEADSDALQREVSEWMDGVAVNDMEQSLQAFYRSQGNEAYEQGFSIGEPVFSEDGRDIVRLNVGDSKGFYFRREDSGLETWYAPPAPRKTTTRDGTELVENVLRNNWLTDQQDPVAFLRKQGYRKLNPERLIYVGFNVEATNPYGTSLMRSMEFVAKTLLTIENATTQSWERFGNPSFHVAYKVASREVAGDATKLEARRKTIADNFSDALTKKRQGNAVDFVTAVGKDDDLVVKVLGQDGQVLEIEAPARHVLEQIIAKLGLPSWMLGYHWSTAERLAQRQGELVLQESRTRFELRRPQLEALVALMLRARGRTWKRGSWRLVQELPSLQDLVAQAQARFLDAQTAMMQDQGPQPGDTGKRFWMGPDGALGFDTKMPGAEATPPLLIRSAAEPHEHKEPFAEDGEYLGGLERQTESRLLRAWSRLRNDTLDVLGLGLHKDETPFVYSAVSMAPQLQDLQEAFEAEAGGADSRLIENMIAAWKRGVENAARDYPNPQELVESVIEQAAAAIRSNGLRQVKTTVGRTYRDDIIAMLERGVLNGQNPADVARELSTRFGAHTADWVRLARSELIMAHADGKEARYMAAGDTEYDFVTAQDGSVCPICSGVADSGPYEFGIGPKPVRDTHPNCRCTIVVR